MSRYSAYASKPWHRSSSSTTNSLSPLQQHHTNFSSPTSPTNESLTRFPSLPSSSTSPQTVAYSETLLPPSLPYGASSAASSRRSSSSLTSKNMQSQAVSTSLSVNYVPAKFSKVHEPGRYAHRRTKSGGGRDAFAKDAQRMGMLGTVDDDEGVAFEVKKGGGLRMKRKRPNLRWNRFKWLLFMANNVVSRRGTGTPLHGCSGG